MALAVFALAVLTLLVIARRVLAARRPLQLRPARDTTRSSGSRLARGSRPPFAPPGELDETDPDLMRFAELEDDRDGDRDNRTELINLSPALADTAELPILREPTVIVDDDQLHGRR